MYVEIKNYNDNWMRVKECTLTTIKKNKGTYPTSEWKSKILLAEHSPIREIQITAKFHDIPYWIVMHLVRHHIGITHYVSTQRTDRTNVDRTKLPQDNLVDYEFTANAQAIINISRKRLCNCASKETREAWKLFLFELEKYEPELVKSCVPECVYRGFCTEMFPCGYDKTNVYTKRCAQYINYKGENDGKESV